MNGAAVWLWGLLGCGLGHGVFAPMMHLPCLFFVAEKRERK